MVVKQLDEYEQNIISYFDLSYNGLIWCELGNQQYHNGEIAKDVYVERGVDHTSIDINGEDGALEIDLDFPVPDELHNRFDVVTNYGTIEHINNQYQAFKNMHMMCRVGGIMIHGFPRENTWKTHSEYYYDIDFIEQLVNLCRYSMYDLRVVGLSHIPANQHLIIVTFMKEFRNFITEVLWIENNF